MKTQFSKLKTKNYFKFGVLLFALFLLTFSFSVFLRAQSPEQETEVKEPKRGQKFFYDSAGRRDPMVLPWELKAKEKKEVPTKPGEAEAELIIPLPTSVSDNVKGIVHSDTEPLALIGDKIVRAGDEIDSVRVVKINPGEIIFFFFGRMHKVIVSGK